MDELYDKLKYKYQKYKNYEVSINQKNILVKKKFKYVNNDFNMSNEYLLVTIIIHKYINYYTLKTHNTLGFNNTYKIKKHEILKKLDTII